MLVRSMGATPIDVIADFDTFLAWLRSATGSEQVPSPDDRIREDLGLDDMEIFQLGLHFVDGLGTSGKVRPDFFEHVTTVRSLYLHYLILSSMPND